MEIVGNKVDENCDRIVAPFPPIGSSIHSSFQVSGDKTRVIDLEVTDVPQGATIQLACNTGHHGHSTSSNRCPFSKQSFGFAAGPRQSVSLDGSFKKRKLPVGTVITVTVSAPSTIGKYIQFTTRKKKAPSRKLLCLPPGGTTGTVCGDTSHF